MVASLSPDRIDGHRRVPVPVRENEQKSGGTLTAVPDTLEEHTPSRANGLERQPGSH